MGLDQQTLKAIKAAVDSLIVSAGAAVNVATADVHSAANSIASRYPTAHAREVEAEIARHLRNRG